MALTGYVIVPLEGRLIEHDGIAQAGRLNLFDRASGDDDFDGLGGGLRAG